jgi:hypothetical protein
MPMVIGLDIAKKIFQLHSVDLETGEIQRSKLKRAELLEHFANLPITIVAWRPAAVLSTGRADSRAGGMRCV